MKNNKQIKRIIASVTGGERMTCENKRQELHHSTTFLDGVITGKPPQYHCIVSIKASEVKQSESIQRFL